MSRCPFSTSPWMLTPRQLKLCPALLKVTLHGPPPLVAHLCTGTASAAPLTSLTFVYHVVLTTSGMPSLPLPLPPGHSSSLDISSSPLTPFPAPTFTLQPLLLTCLLDQPRSRSWAGVSSCKKVTIFEYLICMISHTSVCTHTGTHKPQSCLLGCVRCWDHFL